MGYDTVIMIYLPPTIYALLLTTSIGLATAAEFQPEPDRPFPQERAQHYAPSKGVPTGPIHHIQSDTQETIRVTSDQGSARFENGEWRRVEALMPKAIHPPEHVTVLDSATSTTGSVALASNEGLWERPSDGPWARVVAKDGQGRQWAVEDVRAVTYDAQGRLWFGVLAGLGCRQPDGTWEFYEGKDGLPYNRFTCATADRDGVWFGTEKGAIGFHSDRWRYRQGRRWLIDDHVTALHSDPKGNLWIGTQKGVTQIRFQPMTLQAKAAVYEAEVETLIKRTPFGYTSPVSLPAPGDRSTARRSDNDNDGLWTSMYGAGQCFAFAATHNPDSGKRAKAAFEALRFLQVVTQGGEPAAPKGYVARSIRSTDDPDPNIGRIERDRARQASVDRLWKAYEPRWPRSADGKWYWKGDTSSDELDGHYFFYPLYHDLVAQTEAEKERVRQVVRDLTDHLIAHDYNLTDHDGKPTRWGIFNPESLNHDINWSVERGLNSLSLLSYLTVASHLTGDSKYEARLSELKSRHAYATNAMVPKIQRGIGSGNHSDDEMAFMSFYNLLQYSSDEHLKHQLRKAFHQYWTLEQPELNPFFNFAFAACALGESFTDPWGDHSLAPWPEWLNQSLDTLRAFPLDRANWAHSNSHRLDIVRLPRQQAVDAFDEADATRGLRVNGLVLPVDERYFNHWNTDPFRLDYGGNGTGLGCGTVFLLPYYMGLYHGFIATTD